MISFFIFLCLSEISPDMRCSASNGVMGLVYTWQKKIADCTIGVAPRLSLCSRRELHESYDKKGRLIVAPFSDKE